MLVQKIFNGFVWAADAEFMYWWWSNKHIKMYQCSSESRKTAPTLFIPACSFNPRQTGTLDIFQAFHKVIAIKYLGKEAGLRGGGEGGKTKHNSMDFLSKRLKYASKGVGRGQEMECHILQRRETIAYLMEYKIFICKTIRFWKPNHPPLWCKSGGILQHPTTS